MKYEYDIVVVGGGFSGACAGICAAREGKRVLLVEKYNCMGGVAAFNLINPFMPYKTAGRELVAEIEEKGYDSL